MYRKVRFCTYDESRATAGLVLEADKVKTMGVVEISRLFPMFEAGKMHQLQASPPYDTWEQAFAHDFDQGKDIDYNTVGLI